MERQLEIIKEENKALIDSVLVFTSNEEEANKLIKDSNFISLYEVFNKFVNQLSSNIKVSLFYRANQEVLANRDNLKMFLVLLEGLYRDIYEYQINDVLCMNVPLNTQCAIFLKEKGKTIEK